MPITRPHDRLIDTSKQHATRPLPIAERCVVQIAPTGELIARAVRAWIGATGHAPDVALLHPLRLLTIPSSLWGRYQLIVDGGTVVTLALKPFVVADSDAVECSGSVVAPRQPR